MQGPLAPPPEVRRGRLRRAAAGDPARGLEQLVPDHAAIEAWVKKTGEREGEFFEAHKRWRKNSGGGRRNKPGLLNICEEG